MEDDIDATLNRDRAVLSRVFRRSAEIDGLTIHPQGSERDMNLVQRVYWERNQEREFTVAWKSPRAGIEAFVKRTGADDELLLLYVLSPVGCGYDSLLWQLYSGWMHGDMTPENAMALVDSVAS